MRAPMSRGSTQLSVAAPVLMFLVPSFNRRRSLKVTMMIRGTRGIKPKHTRMITQNQRDKTQDQRDLPCPPYIQCSQPLSLSNSPFLTVPAMQYISGDLPVSKRVFCCIALVPRVHVDNVHPATRIDTITSNPPDLGIPRPSSPP